MKKPPFSASIGGKAQILWAKTFANLYDYFKNPDKLKPADLPEDVRNAMGFRTLKRALPRLKGNVYHTMKEILVLFIQGWRNAPRAINFAIRTNRTALATRCRNKDPQTAYLHVLTLLEHGFLRAKVRLHKGLQLYINPALIVFDKPTDAVPMLNVGQPGGNVAAPSPAPAATESLAGSAMLDHLKQMAEQLRFKFSIDPPMRT